MPKKFDTNPLDPEFPKKVATAQEAQTEYKLSAETLNFPTNVMTDEQTQRFQEAQFQTYANIPDYQPPIVYQTNRLAEMEQPITRKVDKVGLPENILIALPYLPWGIGLVAGLIELLIVPRSEPKVRFHAAQGLAAHIGILIVTTILGFADNFFRFADLANGIFQIVTAVMLVIFAIKAWQGKPVHIESVDDLTEWLEEKIKPKN